MAIRPESHIFCSHLPFELSLCLREDRENDFGLREHFLTDSKAPEDKKKHLLIGVSSDRGLCGAIHTSIAKTLKNEITNLSNAGKEVMVVGVGDKIRGLLQR